MARDGRDFRRAFYTSIGIRDLKETKQAVDALLAEEDTIDLDKLAKICLYHRLPHSTRLTLWRLLLGVLPPVRASWEFVLEQRTSQLRDIQHAAALLYGDGRAAGGELTPMLMVRMALIKLGLARRFDEAKLHTLGLGYLEALADAFVRICDNDRTDAFWMFLLFARAQNLWAVPYLEQPTGRVQHQINALNRLCLADERMSPVVHDTQSEVESVVQGWFRSLFADVLPAASLERIYDVVIGGSPSVFVYVALALLQAQRPRLSAVRRKDDIAALYARMSDDALEAVTGQALELWEKSQAIP